jgi:hypothetical protein
VNTVYHVLVVLMLLQDPENPRGKLEQFTWVYPTMLESQKECKDLIPEYTRKFSKIRNMKRITVQCKRIDVNFPAERMRR